MTRLQLERVIRAAAAIANDSDIVVIGSQAVLGQFPSAPRELLMSMDADVCPRNHPEHSGDHTRKDRTPVRRGSLTAQHLEFFEGAWPVRAEEPR
jgi:hypothetical protein